jgi:hypothetical protein
MLIRSSPSGFTGRSRLGWFREEKTCLIPSDQLDMAIMIRFGAAKWPEVCPAQGLHLCSRGPGCGDDPIRRSWRFAVIAVNRENLGAGESAAVEADLVDGAIPAIPTTSEVASDVER